MAKVLIQNFFHALWQFCSNLFYSSKDWIVLSHAVYMSKGWIVIHLIIVAALSCVVIYYINDDVCTQTSDYNKVDETIDDILKAL